MTAAILASLVHDECQTQFNSFNFFSIENEAKQIHLFPLIMRTIYYIKIFAPLIREAFGYLFVSCFFLLCVCVCRNAYSNWIAKKNQQIFIWCNAMRNNLHLHVFVVDVFSVLMWLCGSMQFVIDFEEQLYIWFDLILHNYLDSAKK